MNKGYTAERETPVGGFGTVGAVLSLALGSGVVVFVGSGLLTWAVGWPVRVPLGLAGVVVLVTWLTWIVKVEGLWWAVETVKPEVELEPVPVREVVSVEVSEPAAGRFRFLDVPGGAEALQALASGVVSGRTLSEAEWTGAGGPYSRADFRQLRGVMIERGLLAWRHPDAPSQGVELTEIGQQVFDQIARAPRTRTPGGPFALGGQEVGKGV